MSPYRVTRKSRTAISRVFALMFWVLSSKGNKFWKQWVQYQSYSGFDRVSQCSDLQTGFLTSTICSFLHFLQCVAGFPRSRPNFGRVLPQTVHILFMTSNIWSVLHEPQCVAALDRSRPNTGIFLPQTVHILSMTFNIWSVLHFAQCVAGFPRSRPNFGCFL